MRIRYIVWFISIFFVLSACGKDETIERQVSAFSFQNQNEQVFGTDELSGEIWVASFVFANCETVCPPMMMEMADLQEKFKEEGIDAGLVTFTVDPEVDSPEVLKEYLCKFTDDESNWHMLTGYSQEEIEEFAREEFQTIVQKPDSSDQVIHGTNFYLVDEDGYIINEYNYIDADYMEEMVEEIHDMGSE